jgi:hypothetical protein
VRGDASVLDYPARQSDATPLVDGQKVKHQRRPCPSRGQGSAAARPLINTHPGGSYTVGKSNTAIGELHTSFSMHVVRQLTLLSV